MYFQLKDFKPSVWMGDAVINCYATVLNYEVNGRKTAKGKSKEVYKKIGERRLFGHTVCFGWLEKFSSVLLNKDASLLKLTGYIVIVFPILENHHFYLVSFDMEKVAISVIDNMHASESILRSFCQLTFGRLFRR
ncbi:putative papain-like cysteine peptidase superfamily [Helianthus anomalus]